MAKKKVGAASTTKHVRLEITDEQHARLRVMAAKAGMSMAAYARMLVVRAIEGKKGGQE